MLLKSLIPRTESYLVKICEDLSFIAKLIAVIMAFLAPLQTVVGVMVLFLLLDTASAIYLSFKVHKKRSKYCDKELSKITYRYRCARLLWSIIDPDKLSRTAEKLFAYPVIAIACYVFDQLVLGIEPSNGGGIGRFSLTNLAFILICFTDFKSFLRNMGKATGNEVYRLIEKILAKKIGQKIYKK